MDSEAKRSHLKAEMLQATAICVFSAWEPRVSKNCVKSDEAKFIRAAQPSTHVTFLKGFTHPLENVWGSAGCNELNELSAFVSMRLGCSGPGIRSALCVEACLGQSTDLNICSIVATSVSLASTCTALCWVPIHKPHTNISTCLEPNSSQYMKSFHHSF